MASLIGLCGLAGAGKTTAIDLLEQRGRGVRVYIGAFVTAEVERRGLPPGAISEKQIREDLRVSEGMDALARRALPTIHSILAASRAALLDAIYCAEERDLYLQEFGNRLVTIAVDTSVANRAKRLSVRNQRPLSAFELAERDRYEIDRLGTAEVMDRAAHSLCNDGSLSEFEQTLNKLVGRLDGSPGA
jgi:dephospho-CoA kinase